MQEILIKVNNIDTRRAVKGYDYKLVTFIEVVTDGETDRPTGRIGLRCFWPKRRNVQVLYTRTGEIKFEDWPGDIEYEKISIGDLFTGKIIEYNTTEFNFDGKNVTKYPCVILESDRHILKTAAKQVDFYGGILYDENGKLYNYDPEKIEV